MFVSNNDFSSSNKFLTTVFFFYIVICHQIKSNRSFSLCVATEGETVAEECKPFFNVPVIFIKHVGFGAFFTPNAPFVFCYFLQIYYKKLSIGSVRKFLLLKYEFILQCRSLWCSRRADYRKSRSYFGKNLNNVVRNWKKKLQNFVFFFGCMIDYLVKMQMLQHGYMSNDTKTSLKNTFEWHF